MKRIVSGVLVGLLVLIALLVAFGSGTGPVELTLWVLLAIAAGVAAARFVVSGERVGAPQD